MFRFCSRVSLTALAVGVALPGAAFAADEGSAQGAVNQATGMVPDGAVDEPSIVIRNDLNPNGPPPGGVLDSGISGVGQMTIRGDPATTSMNVCTGTLINPRMVIFAAHCVNGRPAEAYGENGIGFGAQPSGTPIAFGFNADNLPAVRQWLGLDGGTAGATNIALALYAVEQVWYDPRSRDPASCTSPSSCFLQGDVAIATLDTPAFDIPTWAMLFSPLDGPTHVAITGYGGAGRENGSSVAIDWRRRSAENMLAALGSLDDKQRWLFDVPHQSTSSLYFYDFSDPNPNYGAPGKYDFGTFGSQPALAREGTTAGGDSGGPLIVDQKYDIPVVAGVLSGGTRYHNPQLGHNYGTDSFYQPLFAYWDVIVENNPYVYAGALAGNGNWEDSSHWVQLLDPSYMIDVGGELVNGVPATGAQGTAAGGPKFGQICFLDDCTTLSSSPVAGGGLPTPYTGWTPNNITANPSAGIRARYFDVNLTAAGTTTLGSSVEIDRMTLDGSGARLNVASGGILSVLGEYNQIRGGTHVNGTIIGGRDMMVMTGLLSGNGTVRVPYLTVVAGDIAPGSLTDIGTLSVDGNVILSSGAGLLININRSQSDLLDVSGSLSLNNGGLVMSTASGDTPRFGDNYTIATADGGVTGKFGTIVASLGVLRPDVSYRSNDILVTLRANSLVTLGLPFLRPRGTAFATALDNLRDTSYNALYDLYGAVDLMEPARLAATLEGLAPTIVTASRSLQNRQSAAMLGSVTGRLSDLGTTTGGTLSISGSPHAAAIAAAGPVAGVGYQGPSLAQGLAATHTAMTGLPANISGFVAGGFTTGASIVGDVASDRAGGQRSSFVTMGLEMEVDTGVTFGMALGHSAGFSAPGAMGQADSRMNQAMAYGAYRLGGGAYLAGVAAAETGRTRMARSTFIGSGMHDLDGRTDSNRYSLMAEAGVNIAAFNGLQLTPRAAVTWSSQNWDGFRERGGELALQIDDFDQQRLESRVGAKLGGSTMIAGWQLVPQLQADFVTNLSGGADTFAVRFASAAQERILLPMTEGRGSWGEVKGGLRLNRGVVSFGAGVETYFGRSGYNDERAIADFQVRF